MVQIINAQTTVIGLHCSFRCTAGMFCRHRAVIDVRYQRDSVVQLSHCRMVRAERPGELKHRPSSVSLLCAYAKLTEIGYNCGLSKGFLRHLVYCTVRCAAAAGIGVHLLATRSLARGRRPLRTYCVPLSRYDHQSNPPRHGHF